MSAPDTRIAARRMHLLELDASLTPAFEAESARRHLTVPSARISRGAWSLTPASAHRWHRALGMLVLDGSMIRKVRVSGLECCELLGPGDVIRPWDEEDGLESLAARVSWRALEETHVAVLDETFIQLACRWPEVMANLMQRGLRRSRSLAVHLAIAQARRADVRLMALFWHLADRWGRVTYDGIVLDLDLTHSLLSRLTCLRRPTVSLTLKELEATGELVRVSRSHWPLRRTEPESIHELIGLPAAA